MTLARIHRCTLTLSVERLSLHAECYCTNTVDVLMMPSALSRSFCSGKAIWWASEERCHRLLNSVTLQNTDGHYCNQHCLGWNSPLTLWQLEEEICVLLIHFKYFTCCNISAISLQGLMSNTSREDSGLQMFLCDGLQTSLHKTIT